MFDFAKNRARKGAIPYRDGAFYYAFFYYIAPRIYNGSKGWFRGISRRHPTPHIEQATTTITNTSGSIGCLKDGFGVDA
jgi:hypothetical protein